MILLGAMAVEVLIVISMSNAFTQHLQLDMVGSNDQCTSWEPAEGCIDPFKDFHFPPVRVLKQCPATQTCSDSICLLTQVPAGCGDSKWMIMTFCGPIDRDVKPLEWRGTFVYECCNWDALDELCGLCQPSSHKNGCERTLEELGALPRL
jgi:hypothetical protein